jgi:hypothetical protein
LTCWRSNCPHSHPFFGVQPSVSAEESFNEAPPLDLGKSKKKSIKKKFNSSKEKYKSTKNKYKKKYKDKKQTLKKKYGLKKDKFNKKYSAAKDKFKKKSKNLTKQIKKKATSTKTNIAQAIVSKKNSTKFKFQTKLKRFSEVTKNRVRSFGKKYGPKAEQGLATFLTVVKGKSKTAEKQLGKIISSTKRWVKNPENRKKAVSGVVVASAVAYYGYKHKDDIKYGVINTTMENVKVPVNGKMISVETLVSQAVCKNAPFLKNSTLAEDPSAVLAYGVTATAKDDLMNKLEIVPDGRGGVVSVNTAVAQASGSEDALAALEISNSLEGMAMVAAEEGHLGVYGKQFAGTYAHIEENINAHQ